MGVRLRRTARRLRCFPGWRGCAIDVWAAEWNRFAGRDASPCESAHQRNKTPETNRLGPTGSYLPMFRGRRRAEPNPIQPMTSRMARMLSAAVVGKSCSLILLLLNPRHIGTDNERRAGDGWPRLWNLSPRRPHERVGEVGKSATRRSGVRASGPWGSPWSVFQRLDEFTTSAPECRTGALQSRPGPFDRISWSRTQPNSRPTSTLYRNTHENERRPATKE